MAVATMHEGKIGPNAIIQTVAAMQESYGPRQSRTILHCGGLATLPDNLPTAMVDEQEFRALAQMLIRQVGVDSARQLLKRSGQLTAGYLLKHRIPRPVQLLLRALPRRQRLRRLLQAIEKHVWTFAGSGKISFNAEGLPWISIATPALCDTPETAAAVCSFYQGTFEQLLRTLVDRRVALWETECQARGDAACLYLIV